MKALGWTLFLGPFIAAPIWVMIWAKGWKFAILILLTTGLLIGSMSYGLWLLRATVPSAATEKPKNINYAAWQVVCDNNGHWAYRDWSGEVRPDHVFLSKEECLREMQIARKWSDDYDSGELVKRRNAEQAAWKTCAP